MSTCRLTGTIQDSSEVAVIGALVFAVPAMSPAITSSGVAIYPQPVQTATSTGGIFYLNLIRNMDFIVTIPFIGFKEKIRVPDSEEYNIFNLTSVEIVTNPSSGTSDPADPNVNW